MSTAKPTWVEALGNVPIDFWTCPVEGHSDRSAPRSRPGPTVEWDGDVATCLFPGCGRRSDEPDRRECCCETYEPCAGECCGPGQCTCSDATEPDA